MIAVVFCAIWGTVAKSPMRGCWVLPTQTERYGKGLQNACVAYGCLFSSNVSARLSSDFETARRVPMSIQRLQDTHHQLCYHCSGGNSASSSTRFRQVSCPKAWSPTTTSAAEVEHYGDIWKCFATMERQHVRNANRKQKLFSPRACRQRTTSANPSSVPVEKASRGPRQPPRFHNC